MIEQVKLHKLPPLAAIEPRLRTLLPADLYALCWVDPSPAVLMRAYEHLRTLRRILYDYVPRQVSENLPNPGELRYEWQRGTLMFTDLSGFTRLMEANAARGQAGAEALLAVLNTYFATMIEIISKSGGNMLEFTGDAMLAQFSGDARLNDTVQAIRAGLRMQRAMMPFANLETNHITYSLGMRVGIHAGRFFTADIGTPRRMEHLMLGNTVQRTKLAEGAGQVGRVSVTEEAYALVRDQFRAEPGKPGHILIVDDLGAALGEYDIVPPTFRAGGNVLLSRSTETLVREIDEMTARVEPLASYIPLPFLTLLVQSAATRKIAPDFPEPTVVFVNLIGPPEAVDAAQPEEEPKLVETFSRLFSLINAAVETRGGVLKKVTYHVGGSDIVIYFGVPTAHTDNTARAANAALAIRDIVTGLKPTIVGGQPVTATCQIGLACGNVFSAEIGEPRGRREFNVLGDTVNTSARLMDRAVGNRIFMTETVYHNIRDKFEINALEPISLKGKSAPTPVYELLGPAKAE